MLVLSRHRDESIIIGDDVVITVVDIRGDKVRLGIAAPIELSVHRQEVYEAIQREHLEANGCYVRARSLARKPAPPTPDRPLLNAARQALEFIAKSGYAHTTMAARLAEAIAFEEGSEA